MCCEHMSVEETVDMMTYNRLMMQTYHYITPHTLFGPSSTLVLTMPTPVRARLMRGLGSEGPSKRAA